MRAAAACAAALMLTADAPRFDIAKTDVLVDDGVAIAASGFAPGASITVTLRGGAGDQLTSSATFVADANGAIDLGKMAPTRGSYKGADAMGLFWSVTRKSPPQDEDAGESSPESWTLTAEAAGAPPARATLRRRAVAEGVRISPVRENGLVGMFYEPPDAGRHPSIIVLGGSGGGIPPAIGPAGGFASRGYAVLALAYFGAPGLPRTLSNIPLEYFGTALQWLANR
ncbi:MAG TPA: acyl-CoA thioesterase/BAAT N-terminal domain-containing protein, partial [Vicinamibacterales bacterium]